MDNPTPPSLSNLENLRTVEFKLGIKGYNVDDVDEYLEKAAVEAEAIQEHLRLANERVRQANDRVAQLEGELRQQSAEPEAEPAAADKGESLHRTLELAERVLGQIKAESEQEAAEVVTKAKERARAVLSDAEDQARKLQHESEQKLREEVTRLETMRTRLAADVENMAKHLESERNRLHSTLGDMLQWVEEHFQPGDSLMAVHKADADDDSGEVAQVLDLHSAAPGQ